MYTLTRIDSPFAGLIYQKFTFPQFRSHLKILKVEASTVAIAASDSHKPIGLALAEIQPNGQLAEVLSIFVEPTYRCQEVGTALFNSFPPSFTFFPWQEITLEERLNLQKQQETFPWIPQELSPFKHEENLEPLNSLGLRYKGEVVGWIITHRLSPDTIRYTCAYIRPDFQKVGRILSLYAESVKLQGAKPEIPNAIWTVPLKFESYANFVKKRMGEYMDSLEESRGSFKSLRYCQLNLRKEIEYKIPP